MKARAIFLTLSCLVVLFGCDRNSWPPDRARLVGIFEQQKETFEEFERQMAADGLLRMSPGVFTEMERNPTLPKLPSDQAQRYLTLFDRAQMFVSVVRRENSTKFELLIENDGPRLYLSSFIHSTSESALPKCHPNMQDLHCGTCSIYLERDWLVEYSWFPANPDEEARLC